MANNVWDDGEPTESTMLQGQGVNNIEQASGSNACWPSAASYTPPDATTLWGLPSQQNDNVCDSGTGSNTVSSA
eukprot:5654399-Pyramimonas_sp.AAC.1